MPKGATHRKAYCGLYLGSDFPQRFERCHANYASNIRQGPARGV